MVLIKTLSDSEQTLTNSWADVGGEIVTDGHDDIGLWIKLTINNSNNIQFRFLGKHVEEHADEYELMSETFSSGKDIEDPHIHELNSDTDQKIFLHFSLKGEIPVLQMQAKVLTVGVTGATLDEVKYSLN